MWVVVKTKPNQEIKARHNLDNQGFKTCLPILRQKKFYRGNWVDFNEIIFKGYIFVKKDYSFKNIHKINNTYGVSNILINKSTFIPYEISDKELDEVIAIIDNNNTEFKEGDPVVYTKGINSKIIGTLKRRLNNNRAVILLNIFGKDQEILVLLNNLQKII